jgi:hypothetical protein
LIHFYKRVRMTAFCSLVYWENPIASGVVFGSVLASLISLSYYSLIYVCSNLALFMLLAVLGMKLYTKVVVMLGKNELAEGCPLDQLATMNVAIPTENMEVYSKQMAEKLNLGLAELRRLLLVDNMVDTVKFGLSLWFLTYIGAWFNAMTLIILAWLAAFSLPKVYLMNQAKADEILNKVMVQVEEIKSKVMAVVPVKAAPVEKKEE